MHKVIKIISFTFRLGFYTIVGLALFTLNAQTLANTQWHTAGGDPSNSQYSPLDQINKDNVHLLRKAWVYHCGDARENKGSQIQCNPIIVHDTLYATTPQLKLIALNAATGKLQWSFDPFAQGANLNSLGVNRGVVFWEQEGDQRILFTAGQFLFCLDARTGELKTGFGKQGSVDLRIGLDRDIGGLHVLSNSPGVVYQDLLILGTRVSEGPGPSAPGHIRAFNVLTGDIAWIFHTIPHPGEFGYETWPEEAWKVIGGANAWSGISLDVNRGWVFLPTGSPAFDFWGGNRHGQNLFGNCLLVLDARTGKRVWHYQFVHHDLWDRDLPAAPNLIQVMHQGEKIDAVAQITKSGHVFVFNRVTGDPLFPIEELPTPVSDLKGEQAWPTQPLPQRPPPFSRQWLTPETVTNRTPEAKAHILEKLQAIRTGASFIPPSTVGTVIFPGFDGGAEWGGAAWDPSLGVLYVNANEMPWILTMVENNPSEALKNLTPGERIFRQMCATCHGLNRRGDSAKTVPSLVGIKDRLKPTDIHLLLQQGKGVMPGFAFLSLQEQEAVVDFLMEEPETANDPSLKHILPDELASNLAEIPYTHTGYNRFFDPDGYPAVKPPWGTLNAIELSKGEILWSVPLGELEELSEKGLPPTGTENYGGPAVTAGGLVFIAASKDEKFRAFDKNTGRILWETTLPAGGYATPSVYAVNGRQYVVIAAGGGKMGTKSGDAYIAFALPENQP